MWRLIAKRARAYHRAGRVVTADGEVGVGYTVQVRVWATLPPIANEPQRTLFVCEGRGVEGGGGLKESVNAHMQHIRRRICLHSIPL